MTSDFEGLYFLVAACYSQCPANCMAIFYTFQDNLKVHSGTRVIHHPIIIKCPTVFTHANVADRWHSHT